MLYMHTAVHVPRGTHVPRPCCARSNISDREAAERNAPAPQNGHTIACPTHVLSRSTAGCRNPVIWPLCHHGLPHRATGR